MPNVKSMDFDAFASGQVNSKIWLCEELEAIVGQRQLDGPVVWILGGWYGLTGFLLLSRDRMPIRQVRSFDIDPACRPNADLVNENWVWQEWRFKAFTADCCQLTFTDGEYGPGPDIIINTSVEHMENHEWWTRIPPGKLVLLQTCNMIHPDHHCLSESAEALMRQFPAAQSLYKGEKEFKYPEWRFKRFMTIGIK
jgi:hypothetical protein